MVADTKDTMSAELPDLTDSDPFPSMQKALDEILKALRGIVTGGEMEWIFDGVAGGTMQGNDTWQRLRCSALVFSTSAAATVTLTVGTRARSWNVPAADTRVIPLPLVIERGADVTLLASAGTVTGSLIATPE